MGDERVAGRVIDGHSHLGEMAAWKFYDLKEAVKPTVYEFATPKDYIQHLDAYGCERGLVLPNYGIPKQEQPFLLNPLVLDEPEAVDLFCARAGAAPDGAVRGLCRELDNLPLALELAAARASVLSPQQILERVSERLDLLRGGRDADRRP